MDLAVGMDALLEGVEVRAALRPLAQELAREVR
jgi:hypothetical protein